MYQNLVQKYFQQQGRDHFSAKDERVCVFVRNGENSRCEGRLSRETTGRMVDVGMEWKRQGWYVLVGDGTGYKMACCWVVCDKTGGSSSEYSIGTFLC